MKHCGARLRARTVELRVGIVSGVDDWNFAT